MILRQPLSVLGDLSTVLGQLDALTLKRSKLITELTADKTVTGEQVQDFLSLAKLPSADIDALVREFENLRGGATTR